MKKCYEDEWYEETNVARKIKDFLILSGWEIKQFNEDKKKRGPDIVAIRGNRKLIIEVKGFPWDRYTRDIGNKKKGMPKPTPPNLQAKHWFAEALLSLIIQKSEDPVIEIGMGLPKFEKYMELIEKTEILRKTIGLQFYLVNEQGKVEVISK